MEQRSGTDRGVGRRCAVLSPREARRGFALFAGSRGLLVSGVQQHLDGRYLLYASAPDLSVVPKARQTQSLPAKQKTDVYLK